MVGTASFVDGERMRETPILRIKGERPKRRSRRGATQDSFATLTPQIFYGSDFPEINMSWERRGQKLFYTRTRRQNGRVIREFVGKDRLAKLAAEQDRHRQEVRVQLSADIRAVISQLRYSEHLLRKVRKQVRIAVHNAMAAKGYFQHARCSWRKSRRSRTMTLLKNEVTESEDDFLDDPLLQFVPEDFINESTGQSDRDETQPPTPNPAPIPEQDSDSDIPLRQLPDDLFMVKKAKESLFRVLGIAADSRTIFEDDLRVIWNQITQPGDPPAVLLLAEQYLLEWLRFHVSVIKQNTTTASESHIKLIESFQKGANSSSKHLVDLAKQIITIRKMLTTESPGNVLRKPTPIKPSSQSGPKPRKSPNFGPTSPSMTD